MKHKLSMRTGLITIGSRDVELPPDAVVSVTRGEHFPGWPYFLNTIGNLIVIRQMLRHPGLLYAELQGMPELSGGQTLSVWRGREMVQFRDNGAHRWAMTALGWTFYSGETDAYFATFAARGRIPTFEDAGAIALAHGKHTHGGKLVRSASRPEWPAGAAASVAD